MATVRELVARFGLKVDSAGFAAADAAMAKVKAAATTIGPAANDAVSALGGIKGALLSIGAVASALKVANTFQGWVEEINQLTSRLGKLAPQLGLSVQETQSWEHAARRTGATVEDFAGAMKTLSSNVRAAGLGSKEANIALGGLALRGADGKLKSTGDLFEGIAEKISKLPDGLEKTTKVTKIFGDAGAALLPLLNKGAAGVRELRGEVEAFGATLREEDIQAAREYRGEISRFGLAFSSVKQAVAGPLLADFSKLLKAFNEFLKGRVAEDVKRIREEFQRMASPGSVVLRILEAVYKTITFMLSNIRLMQIFGASLAAATVAFTLLGGAGVSSGLATAAAWAIAFIKFLLVAALIAGAILLVNSFIRYLRGADSVVGDLVEDFKRWLFEFSQPQEGDPWWLSVLREGARYFTSGELEAGLKKFAATAKAVFSDLTAFAKEFFGVIGEIGDIFKGLGRFLADPTGKLAAMDEETRKNVEATKAYRAAVAQLRGGGALGESPLAQTLTSLVGVRPALVSAGPSQQQTFGGAVAESRPGAGRPNLTQNITVQGVNDPAATAQQMQRIAREEQERAYSSLDVE